MGIRIVPVPSLRLIELISSHHSRQRASGKLMARKELLTGCNASNCECELTRMHRRAGKGSSFTLPGAVRQKTLAETTALV